MTSRDFGFTTLRSAVAYRRNNTLVPPNNVYITSTNGAAIFSDTLTISTINVSTINGGGGGGGVNSVTAGTNISTTGTASNPIINVAISSPLDMNGQLLIDSIGNLTLSTTTTDIYLNSGNSISILSLGGDITVDSDAAINLLSPDGHINISTGSGPGRYVTVDTELLTLSSIGDINITTGSNITVNGTIMTVNGNLAVLSSAITQQIVTSSITTTPFILDSGFFGKYTFVSTNVAANITLPSLASEGSVLILKNLMTNAASTITITPVYSGGTISADTAASYVFTTYAGNSWVSL